MPCIWGKLERVFPSMYGDDSYWDAMSAGSRPTMQPCLSRYHAFLLYRYAGGSSYRYVDKII